MLGGGGTTLTTMSVHRVQRTAGVLTLALAVVLSILLWLHARSWFEEHGMTLPAPPLILHGVAIGALVLLGLQVVLTAGRTFRGPARALALGLAVACDGLAVALGDPRSMLGIGEQVTLGWLLALSALWFVGFVRRSRREAVRQAQRRAARDATAPLEIADTPVLHETEEQLGRMDLVRVLSNRISSYTGSRALVVGVCGPPGSGKTSLAHLLVRDVDRATRSADRILLEPVHFSPYVLGAGQDLAQTILREIGRRVKAGGRGEDIDLEVGQQITEIATTLAMAEMVIPPYLLSLTRAAAISTTVRRVIAFLSGDPVRTMGETTDAVSDRLSESGALLLVVLDDLERLSAVQLKSVLRVISATGAFHNTVYVLAMDRIVVARTLDQMYGNGHAQLDRSVHLSFDLPAPEPDLLRAYFLRQLDRIRASRRTLNLDEQRLSELWSTSLQSLVRTPRDVTRVLASFDLALDSANDETDQVDLLARTALGVLSPRRSEPSP